MIKLLIKSHFKLLLHVRCLFARRIRLMDINMNPTLCSTDIGKSFMLSLTINSHWNRDRSSSSIRDALIRDTTVLESSFYSLTLLKRDSNTGVFEWDFRNFWWNFWWILIETTTKKEKRKTMNNLPLPAIKLL